MALKIFSWIFFAIAIGLNIAGVYVWRTEGSVRMLPILTWSGAFAMLISVIIMKIRK